MRALYIRRNKVSDRAVVETWLRIIILVVSFAAGMFIVSGFNIHSPWVGGLLNGFICGITQLLVPVVMDRWGSDL